VIVREQLFDEATELGIAGAAGRQQRRSLRYIVRDEVVKDRLSFEQARAVHDSSNLSTNFKLATAHSFSRRRVKSNVRTNRQSRSAVATEIPSAAADSAIVRPAK